MNILDEIKNIRHWLSELNRLLMQIRGAGGTGEANTASNQGAGGIGFYDGKVGVDLQFRNINAASNKVTVALDAPNKEVDIDLDVTKIDHDALLNYVVNQHIDWTNCASALLTTASITGGFIYTDATNPRFYWKESGTLRAEFRYGAAANALILYTLNAAGPALTERMRISGELDAVRIGIGGVGIAGADLTLCSPGVLALKETVTPAAGAGYGKFYTKNDNKVYFQDGAGVEHELAYSGGAGEANTASNQGVGGVGLYDAKVGVDLQFRNINAASNKITVVLDAPNKEVDIDVDPSKIDLGDLGDVSAAAPNDDDVLTWDAGGSQWQPEAGGGGGGGAVNPFAFRRTGRCYTTWACYPFTTFGIFRNTLYAYPFIVPVAQSFDRIIVAVSLARTNGVARIGIYDDSGVYPNSRILDSGELDCSASGYKPTVIAETLDPGLYWLVINTDGDADIAFRAMDYNSSSPIGYYALLGKSETIFNALPYTHYRKANAYGALPTPFPAAATMINNENLVGIFLRKA